MQLNQPGEKAVLGGNFLLHTGICIPHKMRIFGDTLINMLYRMKTDGNKFGSTLRW